MRIFWVWCLDFLRVGVNMVADWLAYPGVYLPPRAGCTGCVCGLCGLVACFLVQPPLGALLSRASTAETDVVVRTHNKVVEVFFCHHHVYILRIIQYDQRCFHVYMRRRSFQGLLGNEGTKVDLPGELFFCR